MEYTDIWTYICILHIDRWTSKLMTHLDLCTKIPANLKWIISIKDFLDNVHNSIDKENRYMDTYMHTIHGRIKVPIKFEMARCNSFLDIVSDRKKGCT